MAEVARSRAAPGTATLLTALGAAVLVVAASVGTAALVVAVLLVQAAVAATWHALLRAPGERVGSSVGLVAGVTATVVLTVQSRAEDVGSLALVAVAGLFAAFGQRLTVREQGREPLAALLATTSLVLVEVFAACWLSAGAGAIGPWVVAAGAVAAAIAVAVVAAAGTSTGAVVAAVVAGAAAGATIGWSGPTDFGAGPGAVVAGCAALTALCGAQVRRLAGRSARTAPATVAALPLALAAPATYTMVRIVLG